MKLFITSIHETALMVLIFQLHAKNSMVLSEPYVYMAWYEFESIQNFPVGVSIHLKIKNFRR